MICRGLIRARIKFGSCYVPVSFLLSPLLARLGSRSTKTREEACETVDLLNIIQAALDIIQDSGDIRSDHSKKEELSCSFDDN